uniref:Cyclin-dependent kinase-like 2 n=1 Tax=Sarcophilus harrisii TaxID=9305 RepID=A0A7N4PK81_SARHA
MEKYENLGLVGEGSYGAVMKCKNKNNGRIVAIKKFLESEDNKTVKKIVTREIKLLKQLRHENLVTLLEAFKKRKRWYLVFEFVDHTILDDLDLFPNGLEYPNVQKYLFQIIKGIEFCHNHNIIHRDIKPENILISKSGVVKLCDFGFARMLGAPGEVYTDYVATRWYRAPELLVGDIKYGKAVDIWAIGCLLIEMFTGQPIFPGDSDIDQLYHIVKCLGNLIPRHQELFYKNQLLAKVKLPEAEVAQSLESRFPKLPTVVIDIAKKCLQIDPDKRPFCDELLHHDFFNQDGFAERFSEELKLKIQKDARELSSLKLSKVSKKEKSDSSSKERKTLVTKVSNEKNILQTNKKRWEFSKTEVHFPELNYHLPEVRGIEGIRTRVLPARCSRGQLPSSRTPKLRNIEGLHHDCTPKSSMTSSRNETINILGEERHGIEYIPLNCLVFPGSNTMEMKGEQKDNGFSLYLKQIQHLPTITTLPPPSW